MIRIIVMAIIGGRFSLRGAILGAYLVVFLGMELVQYMDAYKQFLIIYGLGFIIYFVLPRGLDLRVRGTVESVDATCLPDARAGVGQSVRAWS